MGGGGDHVSIIILEPCGLPDRDWGGADGAVGLSYFQCVLCMEMCSLIATSHEKKIIAKIGVACSTVRSILIVVCNIEIIYHLVVC